MNARFADEETELSDSLSRSGKGSMLASLRAIDGTVAAPAVAFTAEPASGMWRAGVNDIRLAVGGVDALKLGVGGIAGDLSLSGVAVPVIKTTFSNSQLQIQGNRAAADVGSDVGIGSTVARTAGFLAAFQNPISTTNKLLVDWQGLLTLPSPAAAIQPASMVTAIGVNSGWSALNGLAYFKDVTGVVRFKGELFNSGGANPAFTLPAGYRPTAVRKIAASDGANHVTVVIDTAGVVSVVNAAGTAATGYLDGVAFLAEQ